MRLRLLLHTDTGEAQALTHTDTGEAQALTHTDSGGSSVSLAMEDGRTLLCQQKKRR